MVENYSLYSFENAGKLTENIELDHGIFAVPYNETVIKLVVAYQLAKRRRGTHSVKMRATVSGGGCKPFRQKGTGRARSGTIRAPHYRGGAVVMGPVLRDHSINVNKRVRSLALRMVLSRCLAEGKLVLIDALMSVEGKTAAFGKHLRDLMVVARGVDKEWSGRVLLLDGYDTDKRVLLASRNIPNVSVLTCMGINVYDILRSKYLFLTTSGLEGLRARLLQDLLKGSRKGTYEV